MAGNGFRAFQSAKLSPQHTQLNTISYIFLPQIKLNTEKTVLSGDSKIRPKLVFKTGYRLRQAKIISECSKGGGGSSILLTFFKVQFVKIVLCMSMFEWSLKTGFTVTKNRILAASSCTHMLHAYLRTRMYAPADTSINFYVNACLTFSNLFE